MIKRKYCIIGYIIEQDNIMTFHRVQRVLNFVNMKTSLWLVQCYFSCVLAKFQTLTREFPNCFQLFNSFHMILFFLRNQSSFNVNSNKRNYNSNSNVREISQCNSSYGGWEKNYQHNKIIQKVNWKTQHQNPTMTYMAMNTSKIQLGKNQNTWFIKTYNFNNLTLNLHNFRLCKKG